MQKNAPSCHLYGFMARDTPTAVLLRRGPGKWVQQILWDTKTDNFNEGQWLKGRVYPSSCDLSPDGSLFIYLARKAECPERKNSDYTYKWTAISKPPYFTALALWPLGDEWFGGGKFIENDMIHLYHQKADIHPRHQLKEGLKVSDHAISLANPRPDLFSNYDWLRVQQATYYDEPEKGSATKTPFVYHKITPHHHYLLVKEFHRRSSSSMALDVLYFVVDTTTTRRMLLSDVEWADWDQQGRLVFTYSGKLFVTTTYTIYREAKVIADFTANAYTSVITPDWARQW